MTRKIERMDDCYNGNPLAWGGREVMDLIEALGAIADGMRDAGEHEDAGILDRVAAAIDQLREAIAAAPQPPAEAQSVACDWPSCDCTNGRAECGRKISQTPSAPVGVDGFDAWYDEYSKQNYSEEMLARAAWEAALAQQPAATFSTPDDIGLTMGPDDVPRLLIAGAEVAKFPAGSWEKVCEALDFGGYQKDQPAAVDADKVFHAVSAYVSPADRSYFRKALEQAIAAQPGGA